MHRRGIIVIGSINTDLVVRGPRLPQPGETVLGGEFFEAPGGKGANQAVAAARAGGEDVTFLSAVGDDAFGRAARERLATERIRCDWIKRVAGRPSGVALILVDEQGENLIGVASGANLDFVPEDVDDVPDEVFRRAGVLLACLESPWPTVQRGIERAKAAGLLTILNPAPAREGVARREWLEQIDVLTPNEREAAMLAGVDAAAPDAARRSAEILRNLGCRACIVTLGRAGALIVDNEVTELPARAVNAVDATAAGDAFNGALAVALAEGKPLIEAARWAIAAASISVTRHGAQPSLPNREEIDAVVASTP